MIRLVMAVRVAWSAVAGTPFMLTATPWDLHEPVPALAQGQPPPGLVLARRLRRKANQVWIFAERFDISATNNGSENAIRGIKLADKVKGCWRTLATMQRHCRIRSYLATARSHGRRPVDATLDAFTGIPSMPPTTA